MFKKSIVNQAEKKNRGVSKIITAAFKSKQD